MKKIVYFYSQEELLWHGNRTLQDLVADEKPSIYCHMELLRQLKTQKNWVVELCRMDEVYAKRGYREAEAIIIDRCRDSDYAWFMSTARPQFLTDRTFGVIKAQCPATQIILNSHDELKYHSIMTCCLARDADAIIVSDHPIGAEILSGLAHPARPESAPLEPSTPTHKRYKATRYQYLFRFLSRGQIRKALPELSVLRYGFPDASWLKEIRHLRQVGRRIGEQ